MRNAAFMVAVLFLAAEVRAQVPDASLASGRPLAPFTLTLRPAVQMSPLPPWMPAPATVSEETATVTIPLPALWQAPAADFYALTVVFDDTGDGGPAIEWRTPAGTTQTVSAGIGEPGVALGWNARTILLPRELTREGGVLLVSYYGKFRGLISVTVRPAREDILAVLGARTDPALVDEALRVFERREVDGLRAPPVTGDVRHGSVVEAELSAAIEPISEELEFLIPIEGDIEATMLRLDVLGLDPEAVLEVRINGIGIGTVGFPGFRLDDPSVIPEALDRLIIAGWRPGALFIPPRFWLPGENSLVVRLKRSEMESGRPVFLRNTALHVRFGATAAVPPQAPVFIEEDPEPDFTLPDPLVPDPADPPLPEIITGHR